MSAMDSFKNLDVEEIMKIPNKYENPYKDTILSI